MKRVEAGGPIRGLLESRYEGVRELKAVVIIITEGKDNEKYLKEESTRFCEYETILKSDPLPRVLSI